MRSLANAFGSRSSAIFGACGALGARGAGPAPRAAARRQGRSLPAPAGPRADAQPSPSCLVPSFRSLAAHASTSAMADRPLRVLAFHGYLQTGQTFRERTGPLRRALKNKVEFIFLDGPFKALSTDEVLQRPDGKRIEGKGDEVVEGKGWCARVGVGDRGRGRGGGGPRGGREGRVRPGRASRAAGGERRVMRGQKGRGSGGGGGGGWDHPRVLGDAMGGDVGDDGLRG